MIKLSASPAGKSVEKIVIFSSLLIFGFSFVGIFGAGDVQYSMT